MCTHQGITRINTGQCATDCLGCQWPTSVTATTAGTSCKFSYEVRRENCTTQPDRTWRGNVTLQCGTSTTISFPCNDTDQSCIGYDLILTAHPCPTPPGNVGESSSGQLT